MSNRSKPHPIPVFLIAALAAFSSGALSGAALAASTTPVKDTANLRLLKASGSVLIEAGKANGTLPGEVQVALKINGRNANSSFKFALQNGSIWGHASGKLKIGWGGYESFGGSLAVDGGTGRFAHASGSGGLYGTLDRNNYTMTVQVKGSLHT